MFLYLSRGPSWAYMGKCGQCVSGCVHYDRAVPLCQREYNCVTVFPDCCIIWYTWSWDQRAQGWSWAPQETLKKMNEGGDDEPSLMLSISDWNVLPIIYSSFVSRINVINAYERDCDLSSRGFWEDWSIMWQQRTWSKWFLLKVLVIYSALCKPEARTVMNMTSAPSLRGELIL